MRIGLDFDNTIVCYDRLFHALAVERDLIPYQTAARKSAVRNALRIAGRENDWTELQGIAYGPRIADAPPFGGALGFVQACRRRRIPVAIISHKTRYPYRGFSHDLHDAAFAWLTNQGFIGPDALSPGDVFFEETKAAKLARIAVERVTAFVDDLPEFLSEPAFPPGVVRVLFDPAEAHPVSAQYIAVSSWGQIWTTLCQEAIA